MESQKGKRQGLQIFGSFFLEESEFAIEVGKIREVVNAPEKLTDIPLAPNFLRGIFNLRGDVIPVIDLGIIFGLTATQNKDSSSKVAIVEYGKSCIGVLFDRTGEIFRSNDEEKSEFAHKGGSRNHQIISGVFKKDGGERLVQILDVEAIFELENIPYESQDSSFPNGRRSLRQKRGARKQCISFLVEKSRCALPIDSIQEILKVESANQSALATHQCIGTINLRGTTVPIMDFAALLGFRETDRRPDATRGERRVIVMRLGEELFGLLVDTVESIISFFADDLVRFPVIAKSRADMIVGCISRENENDILLLDHSKILMISEIEEITHGRNKIYKVQSDARGASLKDRQAGSRKTVITFTIDSDFAVAIDEVREIIEYPKELLRPPGLPKHFKGVLNLRGDLVTIVDTRAMYALDLKELPNRKVLIFKSDDDKYGLVVDSVNGIVSFNEDEKMNLPEILYRGVNQHMVEDVREAVQISAGSASRNLLILNTAAVYRRVEKTKAA